jgi:hypothetical protein
VDSAGAAGVAFNGNKFLGDTPALIYECNFITTTNAVPMPKTTKPLAYFAMLGIPSRMAEKAH